MLLLLRELATLCSLRKLFHQDRFCRAPTLTCFIFHSYLVSGCAHGTWKFPGHRSNHPQSAGSLTCCSTREPQMLILKEQAPNNSALHPACPPCAQTPGPPSTLTCLTARSILKPPGQLSSLPPGTLSGLKTHFACCRQSSERHTPPPPGASVS